MHSVLDFVWTLGPLLLVIVGWSLTWLFASYVAREMKKARANASEPSERPPDTLTLVRGIDAINFLRKYSVLIDDVKVGYIGSAEVRHFPVSPGVHRVAVQIDFCKSRELTFETLPGKNIRVNCGSTYNDLRSLYLLLFRRRDYIYVRTEV